MMPLNDRQNPELAVSLIVRNGLAATRVVTGEIEWLIITSQLERL